MKSVKERLYEYFCRIFRREIIRDGFRGILGRDPEEEALQTYSESLPGIGMEEFVKDLTSSKEAWEKQKAAHAEELIRAAYQGVLGREPEEETLRNYREGFREIGSGGLIRELSGSAEAWDKAQMDHARELMTFVYKGVAGKEPDAQILSKLVTQYQLAGINKLDRSIRNLIESQIGWEELFMTHSEKIVTELYRGVFDRNPDQVGYRVHKSAIEIQKSLIPILKQFSRSEELKIKLGILSNPIKNSNKILEISGDEEIIEAINIALYDENTPTYSRKEFRDTLQDSLSIADAVEKIKKSERYMRAKKIASLIPEEMEDRVREKLVFLHIDKTAGTTIHELLKTIYGHEHVLLKHEDQLFRYSLNDLDKFKVVGGHFNYDSIRYSGLDHSRIFTFFRHPLRRFESLYNFWRSHDSNHPNYVIYHKLADSLSVGDLCLHPAIQESRLSWNHMTWAVMGESLWTQWRMALWGKQDSKERIQYLETEVRPKMQRRLESFYFIGEQETFDDTMNSLLERLGRARMIKYERHNDTITNLTTKKGFKKDYQKVVFTNAYSKVVSLKQSTQISSNSKIIEYIKNEKKQ